MPDDSDLGNPWKLPPFTVESVALAAGQKLDWGLSLFGIPALWNLTRGEGVKVAIIDTGIATNHEDLSSAVLDAKDFTGNRGGVSDGNGHGTHVAGTVAARDNASGVVGVAPEASLLVAKVLSDSGSGSSNWVANGVRWAIANHADIISMSLGSPVPDPGIKAAVDSALDAGIIVVCAAGNEGPSLDSVGYPARWPDVISVGAVDRRKQIARFSSRGERVDIVAPGDQILSDWPPNSVAVLSGTSMATPFVTGVITLMLAAHRKSGGSGLTPDAVRGLLRRTAVDAGPPGQDPGYGFGLIAPDVLLADPFVVPPPPPTPTPDTAELGPGDFSETGLAKVRKFFGPYKSLTIKVS